MLPSQVILPSDASSVSAFIVQGNNLLDFFVILPLQVILPSSDVIAVHAIAMVIIQYNKTIVSFCEGNMTILSTLEW